MGHRVHGAHSRFIFYASHLQCLKTKPRFGLAPLCWKSPWCIVTAPLSVIYVFWHLNAASTLPGRNISLCAHSPSGTACTMASSGWRHTLHCLSHDRPDQNASQNMPRLPPCPQSCVYAQVSFLGCSTGTRSADHNVESTCPLSRLKLPEMQYIHSFQDIKIPSKRPFSIPFQTELGNCAFIAYLCYS